MDQPTIYTTPGTGERRQLIKGIWVGLPKRPPLDISGELLDSVFEPESMLTPGAIGYVFGQKALELMRNGRLCYRDAEHWRTMGTLFGAMTAFGDDPQALREFASALEPDTAALICALYTDHYRYSGKRLTRSSSIFHEV